MPPLSATLPCALAGIICLMLDIHLEALKKAYREQIAWMKARAQEYETGNCQHKVIDGAFIHDRTLELAADYRHRANNLQAIIDACERLSTRQ